MNCDYLQKLEEGEVESRQIIISVLVFKVETSGVELKVKRVGFSVAGSRCDWSQRERRASKHGQALFETTWRLL